MGTTYIPGINAAGSLAAGLAAAAVRTTLELGSLNSPLFNGLSLDGGTFEVPTDVTLEFENPADWRTALGLGTSATLNVGTGANNIVQLNGTAQLPAVDGSLLTGISAGADLTLSNLSNYTTARTNLSLGTASSVAFLAQTLSGQSLTGSQATPLLDLSTTWNTSGTPDLIVANITDTASNAASNFINLRVAGISKIKGTKAGDVYCNKIYIGGSTNAHFTSDTSQFYYSQSGSTYVAFSYLGCNLKSTSGFGWSGGEATGGIDLSLFRGGADILEQRRTTNAQTNRLFNTYTSGSGTNASNTIVGEWLAMEWASNVAWLTTRKGTSGGTARDLVLGTDGTEGLRINGTTRAATFPGQITQVPPSSVTLGTNGQFSIETTSNTAGNLVYRGSDGTTRRMALVFV